MSHLLDDVRRLMEQSELVATTASLKSESASILFGHKVRPLSPGEIEQLKEQGNHADDWSRISVAPLFRTDRIRNNRFLGRVVLGAYSGIPVDLGDGAELPTGISDSTIRDCEIANDALIHRVGLLSRTIVQPRAAVVSVDSMTCNGETTFGCGAELVLGNESGGREVRSFAEMTVSVTSRLASNRSDRSTQERYQQLIETYLDRIRTSWTLIASGAIVKDTGQLVDCYVGPHAVISNARRVAQSCLCSNAAEPVKIRDGSCVMQSILQWGASVESMSLVDTSVLCEHSHVERHGKLTASVLGPNSGVAEGEVTSCLVGPFVGFHHQALLIAATWPEGRGNVGYGANIGSNHTGRAPDQEIRCGEGVFFGLGVDIKFPADYSRSPYSVFASGITCLPQRIEFPFSLINTPRLHTDGLSSLINEIVPGWVLAENLYMIRRNEAKYQQRNRARRESFDFDVFRPEIIELMRVARDRMMQVDQRAYYTDKDIPGLGKNYLTDAARQTSIETYDFHIGWYARKGLRQQLIDRGLRASDAAASALLEQSSDDPDWELQRTLLHEEAGPLDIRTLLEELVDRERKIAEDVVRARAKDERRGRKIIDDYDDVHHIAVDDEFVRVTWQRFESRYGEIQKLLS